MIKNIEAMIIEYSRTPSNAMRNIKNGRKKNTNVKMIDIDQYISPVITCPDSGNVEDDEQEDDEQEDDEQEVGEQESGEQEDGDIYDEE